MTNVIVLLGILKLKIFKFSNDFTLMNDFEAQSVEQVLTQMNKDRYAATVKNTHCLNLYSINTDLQLIRIPSCNSIDCHIEVVDKDIYDVEITNETLYKLTCQIQKIAIHLMCRYGLVSDEYTANNVLKKVLNDDIQGPDDIPEFEKFIENTKNAFLSHMDIYIHPITYLLALPGALTFNVIEPLVTKERDIRNIIRFKEFMYEDTLVFKQTVYRNVLKNFLIVYKELVDVLNSQSSCSFTYTPIILSHCITNIHQIKPKDSLGILFDSLKRMAKALRDGINKDSFEVYVQVDSIYREFVGECNQRRIMRQGKSIFDQFNIGADITSLLHLMKENKINPGAENAEIRIVNKAKIFAMIMMRMAIEGRGSYANHEFELFGIPTRPNSALCDGHCRVYTKPKIPKSINKSN